MIDWLNEDIGRLKRSSLFPFRVQKLYYCRGFIVNIPEHMEDNLFEISIRLESDSELCRDTINGVQYCETFPNVAFKYPHGITALHSNLPRDTIAFAYTEECCELFRSLKMLPEKDCFSFTMNKEIEALIAEWRKLVYNLYSGGVPDLLDWVCFKLVGELALSKKKVLPNSVKSKIHNISLYFQLHYDENIDMDIIAEKNGMSRASFFRLWRQFFNISPAQYVIQCRLHNAAARLLQTNLSISTIMKEVNFTSPTAFYRKFYQMYNMTPDEYRHKEYQLFTTKNKE